MRHQRGAGGEEGALEVDRQHAVPFLGADVLDQRPGIDAGVLDQDVEPSEDRRAPPAHGALGMLVFARCRSRRSAVRPRRAAVASPASTSVSAMTTLRAFLDEALGDALADAARRADDQCATLP